MYQEKRLSSSPRHLFNAESDSLNQVKHHKRERGEIRRREKDTCLELCPQFSLDRPWVESDIDKQLVVLVRVSSSDKLEVSRPLHNGVSHSMSVVDILTHAQDVFVQPSDFQRQQGS